MLNQTMQAAVFETEGVLALKTVTVPTIRKDDDVIIRVEAASICGSDLKILEVPPAHPAKKGVIMGHEYLGTVVEVGDGVTALAAGDMLSAQMLLAAFLEAPHSADSPPSPLGD